MSVIPIGPGGWVPGRGDYGTEYADQLVELIEERNCAKGCTHAGTPAEIAEHGPGGCCPVLLRVLMPEAVPELDPRPDGPHCDARDDPATAGIEPLIDLAAARGR